MSLLALAALAASPASVAAGEWGMTADRQPVQQFVLRNARGNEVTLISYGGIVTGIEVPDRHGRKANVALGFGSLADYESRNQDYRFGAIMGRYVGRIGGARFTLDGREIRLVPNSGPNALHGGPGGFDSKVWQGETWTADRHAGVSFHYMSPAGEQGFPGTLRVRVTYRWTNDDALRIDYSATTNAATHLNLTNHSYFNLGGAGSGTVLGHLLTIPSAKMLETDDAGIPTGRAVPVTGTPLDFRRPKRLEACLEASDRGFNHSWLLPGDGRLNFAARLDDPVSGRVMEVWTTEPSIHVYTAGYMSGHDVGAHGGPLRPFESVALETQHYPDSPNRPEFPTTLLRPGEIFRSTTVYRFGTR